MSGSGTEGWGRGSDGTLKPLPLPIDIDQAVPACITKHLVLTQNLPRLSSHSREEAPIIIWEAGRGCPGARPMKAQCSFRPLLPQWRS